MLCGWEGHTVTLPVRHNDCTADRKLYKIAPPPMGRQPLVGQGLPHSSGFSTTFRHTTIGGTPLDGWSAGCRELYQTANNTWHISVPPAGFEPTIQEKNRLQTHASDRNWIGLYNNRSMQKNSTKLRLGDQTSHNTWINRFNLISLCLRV